MKTPNKLNQHVDSVHVKLEPGLHRWKSSYHCAKPPSPPSPPDNMGSTGQMYSHEYPNSKLTKHLLWDLNLSSGQRTLNKFREESLGRYKCLLFSTTSLSLPLFSSDAWKVKKSPFSGTTRAGQMGMWRCSLIRHLYQINSIYFAEINLTWTWLCLSFCECKSK